MQTIKTKQLFQEMSLEINYMEHVLLGEEWRYKNFVRNYSKIYYITGGKGIIRFPDQDIILEPGKLYLVPPFKAADYFVTEQPLDQYYIHFYAKFDNNINIFSLMDFHDYISVDNPELMTYLFNRLNEIYSEPTDFLMVEVDAILRYIISLMRKESSESIEKMVKRTQPFKTVLDHIEKNYSKKISLAEMAALVHLQPTYFSTAFKKVFGLAPVEFVISKKLEKAQDMLFFTDMTVREIAYEVGFTDEFYFSRIFKKYLGISPAKYRIRRKI